MPLSRRNFLTAGLMLSSFTGSFPQVIHASERKQPMLKFFMQAPGQPASTVPYGNNIAHGKYADAGDVKIYYETYGKGEPFLVLHGGGVGCAYEMGCFIDRLQEKYRVIIPSTRGHGRSGFGTEPLNYAQKAQDIMTVLKAERIKKVQILGFSDGAYTAYKIAELFPDVVTHIIAIGAGENIPGLRQVVTSLDVFKQYDADFVAQQQSLSPEPERWASWLVKYGEFWSKELISKNIFMKIRCPVLLISGELDPNAPLDTVLATYREIPEAHLAIIPQAPHQCFLTHFDVVWASIRPYVGL